MAVLIHDCPYCGARDMTFTARHAVQDQRAKGFWSVLLSCQACQRCVVAHCSDMSTGRNPCDHQTDLASRDSLGYSVAVADIQPRAAVSEIPDHLPPAVAKAFKEGCDILGKSHSGACAQFRKALELGLKDKSPEIDAWKLERRIEKMANEGLLTEALKDWAHKLRLDGNGAVHDLEDISREAAQEMESLTRFVLMYLFTLPESVRLAQAKE